MKNEYEFQKKFSIIDNVNCYFGGGGSPPPPPPPPAPPVRQGASTALTSGNATRPSQQKRTSGVASTILTTPGMNYDESKKTTLGA